MSRERYKFTADFETTTNPDDCRVWAVGICEINTLNFEYGNSIEFFFEYFKKIPNSTVYFHNLKFDGSFILNALFRMGYQHTTQKLKLKEFNTLIGDTGQYYAIEIKLAKNNTLHIYDSFKIIPIAISAFSKTFGIPDQKLEIDYLANRERGHRLTDEEVEYLKHDVVIAAKGLNIMFNQGLNKITVGANALAEYKSIIGKKFDYWFPKQKCDSELRRAYKGAFTYCNPKYQNKELGAGMVFDVNSLYPFVMRNRRMPYGEPIFYKGAYDDDPDYPLYVQFFTMSDFYLKPNHLPTLLGDSALFQANTYLEKMPDNEELYLTLTSVDLKLFFEHYDVIEPKFICGWKFKGSDCLFKEFIDKWIKIKNQATIDKNAGLRYIAKLMLNNLYGKFATNPNSKTKIPYLKEDGALGLFLNPESKREPIYIPVGEFITAWARDYTIRSAQANYDRFAYADTDSLHLIGTEPPIGIEVDDVKLGAWKHESTFSRAKYLRAKTYIEEIDGNICVTCAGLPKEAREPKYDEWGNIINTPVTWENFQIGASYTGKLRPKQVPGGIVLEEVPFIIRRK